VIPPEPIEASVDYNKRVKHSTAFYPPGLTDRIVDIMVDHLHDAHPSLPRLQGEAPQGLVFVEPKWEKRWVSKHKKAVEDMMREDEDEQWISQHLGCKMLPEIVQVGAKYRPFADGGGLCSLGRWLPHLRGPRRATNVREAVVIEVGRLHLPSKLKAAALRGFKPCTAANRCGQQGCEPLAPCLREAPWDQQEVDRAILQAIDSSMGKGAMQIQGKRDLGQSWKDLFPRASPAALTTPAPPWTYWRRPYDVIASSGPGPARTSRRRQGTPEVTSCSRSLVMC